MALGRWGWGGMSGLTPRRFSWQAPLVKCSAVVVLTVVGPLFYSLLALYCIITVTTQPMRWDVNYVTGVAHGAHKPQATGAFTEPLPSAAVEVLRLVDRVAVWASHLVAHRLGAGTETRDVDLAQGFARRADAPESETHAARHLGAPLAPEVAHVAIGKHQAHQPLAPPFAHVVMYPRCSSTSI